LLDPGTVSRLLEEGHPIDPAPSLELPAFTTVVALKDDQFFICVIDNVIVNERTITSNLC
jgi:hypothetical protein